MKLAVMQPYFFPYLGYFSLIKHTDRFILLDEVQFIRHGWIERNRILNQKEGWIYIKVPVIREKGRSTLIREIRIDNDKDWKKKILAQLQPYRKTAPYYRQAMDVVHSWISNDYKDIVSLNKTALEQVCDYIGFDHHLQVLSAMELPFLRPEAPDEWALNICKALDGIDEYWNPPGGLAFFDPRKYESEGVRLRFQRINLERYDQKRPGFIEGLSVIDAMMFNVPGDISRMLDKYDLLD
jgi:hypothetical protein